MLKWKRECEGRVTGEDMKKMTAPHMACHWPVALLIELFCFYCFFFCLRHQSRHYTSAICRARPPLLVCDWSNWIWKDLQSVGVSCPLVPNGGLNLALPPLAFVSCFLQRIHHPFLFCSFFRPPGYMRYSVSSSTPLAPESFFLSTPRDRWNELVGSATNKSSCCPN